MPADVQWSNAGLVGLLLILGPQAVAAQSRVNLDRIRESMAGAAADIVVKAPDGDVRPVSPDARSIAVRPGEYVVAKTADRPTEVAAPTGTGRGLQLPVSLTTVAATGAQIALSVVVRTGNGLRPTASALSHEGKIYVGLVNTLDPVTAIKLPAPVQVTLAGPVDSITPDQPQFDTTNSFMAVKVVARNPRDPVELRISTAVDLTDTVVPLSVFNPRVSVLTSVSTIAGFGFETTDVTVQAQGIPKIEGMPVTLFLQGGGGSFVPTSQLKMDANGRATAALRSSGLSPNVVVAATLGDGTTAQAAPIAYVWPIAWLAFAIGGGLMGGLVKQFTGRRKRWLATLVVCVVVGFLAAGLYMLGVSTIPAIPTGTGGQLVVGVVAALAAIGGVGLLPSPK